MAVKGRGGCSERPSPPRSVPATVTGSVQSIPGRWMNRRQALTGTDAQGRTCTPRMGRPMTEQRPNCLHAHHHGPCGVGVRRSARAGTALSAARSGGAVCTMPQRARQHGEHSMSMRARRVNCAAHSAAAGCGASIASARRPGAGPCARRPVISRLDQGMAITLRADAQLLIALPDIGTGICRVSGLVQHVVNEREADVLLDVGGRRVASPNPGRSPEVISQDSWQASLQVRQRSIRST
jgi:hypothetical protein